MERGKNTAFSFQILFNILGWTGVGRTIIEYDVKNCAYGFRNIPVISNFVNIVLKVNYLVKIVYLILLLAGVFPSAVLEFLDYLTVGFWFLVLGLIFISEGFWLRRYPFYEIILAGWKLQNEVCFKLKHSNEFLRKVQISVMKKAVMQVIIMAIGTFAMAIQYASIPKYPIFTGFIVEEDSPLVNIIFGFHDVGFLLTAWIFYGPVICLSSLLGRQISLILKYMEREVQELSQDPEKSVFISLVHRDIPSSSNSDDFQHRYSFQGLIQDYQKLMLYMERLNEFCAYKFLFVHITAYIQMIGDVFIMIQVLRDGGEFMDVFFYLEDCGVCMFMLFKCFKAMSLVDGASRSLLRSYKLTLTSTPHLTYLHKFMRTLKPVALKIGPNNVVSTTVGNAMMVLMNYYIAAALW